MRLELARAFHAPSFFETAEIGLEDPESQALVASESEEMEELESARMNPGTRNNQKLVLVYPAPNSFDVRNPIINYLHFEIFPIKVIISHPPVKLDTTIFSHH